MSKLLSQCDQCLITDVETATEIETTERGEGVTQEREMTTPSVVSEGEMTHEEFMAQIEDDGAGRGEESRG